MSAPAPLPGRDEELRLLDEALAQATTREQQLVVLEGDPGIGKTALLQAFARRHGQRGWRAPRVLYLHAPAQGRYDPVHHAALAATSQRVYRLLGGERQATETARTLLPGWLSAIPIWGALIAAVTATADALYRLRRAERRTPITPDDDVEALLRAAHRRPLVLLLDDLERADREAIARLEALVVTADAGARVLVVGAFRPTPPGVPDPPVHAFLRQLPLQDETYRHRRLGPLTEAQVEQWLRRRFAGAAVPPALAAWLHGQSGGHPATVETALADLQLSRAIRRERGAWSFHVDPQRLRLRERRAEFANLDAVPPGAAEAVRAASMLGTEFDSVELSWLLQRDELMVEDQLAEAVRLGLLENLGEWARPDGELATRYRFRSAHLQAALSQEIAPERWQRRRDAPGGGAAEKRYDLSPLSDPEAV